MDFFLKIQSYHAWLRQDLWSLVKSVSSYFVPTNFQHHIILCQLLLLFCANYFQHHIILCQLLLLFFANYIQHHNSWQTKICRHGTIVESGHDRYWTFCLRREQNWLEKSRFSPGEKHTTVNYCCENIFHGQKNPQTTWTKWAW